MQHMTAKLMWSGKWHILTKTKEMVLLYMHIMGRGSVSEDNGWLLCLLNKQIPFSLRERCKKKIEKKLTSVSFMYVCVAENGEMLVFFLFFPTIV